MKTSPGCLWATAIMVLLWSAQPALADAGNAQAGAKVFKKCNTCHVLTSGKHRVGPSLEGLFGRTAGTSQGYKFSKDMKAYGISGVRGMRRSSIFIWKTALKWSKARRWLSPD